jgi:hypothetical protein
VYNPYLINVIHILRSLKLFALHAINPINIHLTEGTVYLCSQAAQLQRPNKSFPSSIIVDHYFGLLLSPLPLLSSSACCFALACF